MTGNVQPYKKETDLEICLRLTVLLKMLRILDAHQLGQHRNVLSTVLPPYQSPHDSEAFPYIVLSHRPTDC